MDNRNKKNKTQKQKEVDLQVTNLTVAAGDKTILRDVTLEVKRGDVVVLMGENGSGKSTIANAIMGNPEYTIKAGKIKLTGEDITNYSTDERAKKGLFLMFQEPPKIEGVALSHLIKVADKDLRDLNPKRFYDALERSISDMALDSDIAERDLNSGLSGGEKKKTEMVQMLMLKPKIAILDEPDSGLDVDGIKLVGNAIMKAKEQGTGVLLITHYQRVLQYAKPDKVYVMRKGKIVMTGDKQLAEKIESQGYGWINGE